MPKRAYMPCNAMQRVSVKRRKYTPRRKYKARRNPFASLVPGKMVSSHRYTERFSVTDGAFNPDDHIFRLTDLSQPDNTGATHFPSGYEKMRDLYTDWCVTSVDYQFTFTPHSAGDACQVVVFPFIKSYVIPANITNMEEANEIIGAKRCVVPAYDPASKQETTIKGTISLPQIFGETYKDYVANEDHWSNETAEPVDIAGLSVAVENILQDATAVGFVGYFQIVYHVIWRGPDTLFTS